MPSSRRPTRSLERTPMTLCSSACAALCSSGPPRQTASQRAAAREHVEARPLLREEQRVAVHEGGEAADRELEARGGAGQRGEQGHRLEARLGQEAVADPERVEGPRRLGLLGQLDQVAGLDRAQHHRPIRQDQPEGCSRHGVLPGANLGVAMGHVKREAGIAARIAR